MAEGMAKYKGRRIGSALGTAALVLVLMAVIYIAAVLLQTAEDGGEGSWVVVAAFPRQRPEFRRVYLQRRLSRIQGCLQWRWFLRN